MDHKKKKYFICSSKVKRGKKTKHRVVSPQKECSVSSGVALLQRGSVLNSRHYAKVCIDLENKLYTIFMAHRNHEDLDKNMLHCLHSYSDRYFCKITCQDVGFGILIYGSDILSHYGTWDTDKMGLHLKAISTKVTEAESLNSPYFIAAILQALSYQALLKNKYGRANAYISKALEYIQFLEPCEWTSWVYQMYGMINWNLTDVFEPLSDDLFVKAGTAFLKCRDHNLGPHATARFHTKYCALWALLRTAKVKLKLPWHYDSQAMKRFLQRFRVSPEDLKNVEMLTEKAKRDKCELKYLSLYHENIEAEIMELELFAEYRKCQILNCKLCQAEWLTRCCQMYKHLLDCWTFTEDHTQGLKVLYDIMTQQRESCFGSDFHKDGCPHEQYDSDVI